MMAAKRAAASLQPLRAANGLHGTQDPLLHCLTPILSRSMATEASIDTPAQSFPGLSIPSPPLSRAGNPALADVLTTVYSFPTMEPLRFTKYPASFLHLPLRRDILHRAVIFEGDATRQGTASTKWRDDVRGSGRKIRPQKGQGRARLGDKKSPMLRGGGVAFGPHPRDFSTRLPKKIYDLAWRTALSYRYKRGELIVIEDGVELEMAEPRWLKQIMERNHIGKADGKSTIVTRDYRPNLFTALAGLPYHGKAREAEKVDVKNLLESGRIIMEKSVLDSILEVRSSDLRRTVPKAMYD